MTESLRIRKVRRKQREATKTSALLLFTVTLSLVVTVAESRLQSWALPPANHHHSSSSSSSAAAAASGSNFMQECESVAAFLSKLRGGGMSDRGYYYQQQQQQQDDEYYTEAESAYRQKQRQQQYSQDDHYNSRQRSYNNNYGRPQYQGDAEGDDYEDDYYYNDRGMERPRGKSNNNNFSLLNSMPNVIKHGDRRIGLALLGSGAVITALGISLFFNKSLMRLGNLLFIAGVPMTVGPSRTASYFLQTQKARATACLGLGIFLVFMGSPIFGMALEIFGLLNLFGNMFPIFWTIAKQMPIVSNLVKTATAATANPPPERRYSGSSGRRDNEEDYYYNDGYSNRRDNNNNSYGRSSYYDQDGGAGDHSSDDDEDRRYY